MTSSTTLQAILRISSAMCFIGHGAFGIITKAIWCNYFGVFGIGPEVAYRLMPYIGTADILFGLSLLIYPTRAVAGWLVIWGLFTALLRPLSGEPFAEFVERAGNFGAPLVWLMMVGMPQGGVTSWFKPVESRQPIGEDHWDRIILWLKIISFALLLGHGWLNVIEKPGLVNQYSRLGFPQPDLVAQIIGWLEIGGAIMVLFKPLKHVVLVLLVWKMISELFYPAYGIFEWVERGGSYGILLVLLLCLTLQRQKRKVQFSL